MAWPCLVLFLSLAVLMTLGPVPGLPDPLALILGLNLTKGHGQCPEQSGAPVTAPTSPTVATMLPDPGPSAQAATTTTSEAFLDSAAAEAASPNHSYTHPVPLFYMYTGAAFNWSWLKECCPDYGSHESRFSCWRVGFPVVYCTLHTCAAVEIMSCLSEHGDCCKSGQLRTAQILLNCA